MLPGTYLLPANAQYSGVSVTTRDGSGSGGAYPTDGVLTVTVATPEPSAARLLLCSGVLMALFAYATRGKSRQVPF